jgi:hypothetical protein
VKIEFLASVAVIAPDPVREEPWGQTVARLQSLEGASVGISCTPSLRD